MSIRQVTYYQAVCDWPGCGTTAEEGTDYAAWADESGCHDDVESAQWWRGFGEDEWYCETHPAVWASEHEDGTPFPEPPYLLIHDGDTVNSDDDDGKVSLIADVPAGSVPA